MKILGISASPRREKSNSLLLLRELLGAAQKNNFKTELLQLCDYRIRYCRHCELCHRKFMWCSIKDDSCFLQQKILKSDAVVFASPVYIDHITGYLKNFLDRASHFIHCQRLSGKYVAAIAVSGGGPQKAVLEYIKRYALICGAQYSGGISGTAPVSQGLVNKARALGKDLAEAVINKKKYPAQPSAILAHRNYFRKIIELRKNEWPFEYKYWKDKGWLYPIRENR
jgi:multimeric flavodoxin WrbA